MNVLRDDMSSQYNYTVVSSLILDKFGAPGPGSCTVVGVHLALLVCIYCKMHLEGLSVFRHIFLRWWVPIYEYICI